MGWLKKYQTGGPNYKNIAVSDNTSVQTPFIPNSKPAPVYKGPVMKQSSYISPAYRKQLEEEYKWKQTKQNVIKPLLQGADVVSDIMQLGNFIPHPIAQTIGKIGNIAGMGIDAFQTGMDIGEGNYGSAAINAGSMIFPMALESQTFRRNSKYLKPGEPLYQFSPQALGSSKRVQYIEPFIATRHMTDNNLLANRGLLGALATETAIDTKKHGGMIKRADGSYSQRGLWDNIRDNAGSGKKPTKQMLQQEKKIKAAEHKQLGGYSTTGYKADSPDRYNPYNLIPSGRITMQNVPHPVMGVDNYGNRQMMQPGGEYQFPGQSVFEVPMYMQQGGSAIPKIMIDSTGRSYYDPFTGKMYLTPQQYNNPDVYNHESYHKQQDDNGRLSVPEQWGAPLKRPSIVNTDDIKGAYFNRQGLDANIIGNEFIRRYPEAQFLPNNITHRYKDPRNAPPDKVFERFIDPIRYSQPWTVEGEADQYEHEQHNGNYNSIVDRVMSNNRTYQTGGVAPFVTSDLAEYQRRKQAYADSNLLYRRGQENLHNLQSAKNEDEFIAHQNPYSYPDAKAAIERLTQLNGKPPSGNKVHRKFNFFDGADVEVLPPPTQPVIYQPQTQPAIPQLKPEPKPKPRVKQQLQSVSLSQPSFPRTTGEPQPEQININDWNPNEEFWSSPITTPFTPAGFYKKNIIPGLPDVPSRGKGGVIKKYYKGGETNPPIYTSDPHDPRLQAYQDSLSMSNQSDKLLNKAKGHILIQDPVNNPDARYYYNDVFPNRSYHNFSESPTSNVTVEDGFGYREGTGANYIPIFKKPIRLVKYLPRVKQQLQSVPIGDLKQFPVDIKQEIISPIPQPEYQSPYSINIHDWDPTLSRKSDRQMQFLSEEQRQNYIKNTPMHRLGPNRFEQKYKTGGWLNSYQGGGWANPNRLATVNNPVRGISAGTTTANVPGQKMSQKQVDALLKYTQKRADDEAVQADIQRQQADIMSQHMGPAPVYTPYGQEEHAQRLHEMNRDAGRDDQGDPRGYTKWAKENNKGQRADEFIQKIIDAGTAAEGAEGIVKGVGAVGKSASKWLENYGTKIAASNEQRTVSELGKSFITDEKGQSIPFNHATGQSMQQDYIDEITQYFNGPAFKEKMAIYHPDIDPEVYKKSILDNLEQPLVYGEKPGASGYYNVRFNKNNLRYIEGQDNIPVKDRIPLQDRLQYEKIVKQDPFIGGKSFSQYADETVDHELGHQRTNGNALLPDFLTKKYLHDNLSEEGIKQVEKELGSSNNYTFSKYFSEPTEFDTRLMNLRKSLKKEGIVDYTKTNEITPDHIRQLLVGKNEPFSYTGINEKLINHLTMDGKLSENDLFPSDIKDLKEAKKVKERSGINYIEPKITKDGKALLKYHNPEFLSQMMKYLQATLPAGVTLGALKSAMSQQDTKQYGGPDSSIADSKIKTRTENQQFTNKNAATNSDFENYARIINQYQGRPNDTSYMYTKNTMRGNTPYTEQIFYNTGQNTREGLPVSNVNRGQYVGQIPTDSVSYWRNMINRELPYKKHGGWLDQYQSGGIAHPNYSVVDYLASQGQDYSKGHRAELAQQYGIQGYDYSAEKNLELLSKLKAGDSLPQKPAGAPPPVFTEMIGWPRNKPTPPIQISQQQQKYNKDDARATANKQAQINQEIQPQPFSNTKYKGEYQGSFMRQPNILTGPQTSFIPNNYTWSPVRNNASSANTSSNIVSQPVHYSQLPAVVSQLQNKGVIHPDVAKQVIQKLAAFSMPVLDLGDIDTPMNRPANTNKQSTFIPTGSDKLTANPNSGLESGYVVDKEKNMGYIIKDHKVISSFPVITGAGSWLDKEQTLTDAEYEDVNHTLGANKKVTPSGIFYLKPHDKEMYGYKHFDIVDPTTGKELSIANHLTYAPSQRGKAYFETDPRKRDLSFGCVNCQKPSIDKLWAAFPEGTDIHILPRNMNKTIADYTTLPSQKYGGKTKGWLNKY